MNELQVLVEQHPGEVKWNYEELKTALETEMSSYETAVYDDDKIKNAKNDVASLRKLKSSVEARRKEIKNKCLEPYTIIEKQAKELTGLIDKPIELIDKQVKDYEEKQRKARRKEIVGFFEKTFSDIDIEVAKIAGQKRYDERWENATASKKSWQDAIKTLHDSIASDLTVIADVEEDCRDDAMEAYKKNLALSEALQKVNELRRHREAVIAAERKRLEEEERLKREAEERKAREEAIAAEKQEEPVIPVESKPEPVKEPVKPAPQPVIKDLEPTADKMVRIDIHGSDEQIKKILGYIRYIGARWEEV